LSLCGVGKDYIGPLKQKDRAINGHCEERRDFLNRPGAAQRVPGGLGFQISMTFGT